MEWLRYRLDLLHLRQQQRQMPQKHHHHDHRHRHHHHDHRHRHHHHQQQRQQQEQHHHQRQTQQEWQHQLQQVGNTGWWSLSYESFPPSCLQESTKLAARVKEKIIIGKEKLCMAAEKKVRWLRHFGF